MKKNMELYIHVPFCVKKCAYCDFLSFPADEGTKRRYVEKLMEEMRTMGAVCRDNTVSTVFVGGGTPSILKGEWMEELFSVLRENFSLEPDAEISMEANPGTVTKEKLFSYRRAGINRLSFGLQSAKERELSALGRIHSFEDFLESFRAARECGFENINVDLMSALPGQTADSWMETLKRTAELSPEHISAYSLIVEEGTPFYEAYGSEAGRKLLPDEETEREMYHRTKAFLRECGYERYEISNYAKPGFACLHNIGYWTGVPYLGLGLGAASYLNGKRFSGHGDMETYLASAAGTYENEVQLTKKDMEEEFFFLGLRLTKGVSLAEFKERFGEDAAAVYPGVMERFVKEGAANLSDGRFFLTDYGMDVSNYVMAEFLQE
ncbi:oxygen-independent coproporphyrinogen III oxidase [Eubacteriaceae bacterium Marseille-Q4139]|nr:oxygen-independent coproporphyrinogen III oxidase [Eubacteriaceae bacterium Marseille-Q4139]